MIWTAEWSAEAPSFLIKERPHRPVKLPVSVYTLVSPIRWQQSPNLSGLTANIHCFTYTTWTPWLSREWSLYCEARRDSISTHAFTVNSGRTRRTCSPHWQLKPPSGSDTHHFYSYLIGQSMSDGQASLWQGKEEQVSLCQERGHGKICEEASDCHR